MASACAQLVDASEDGIVDRLKRIEDAVQELQWCVVGQWQSAYFGPLGFGFVSAESSPCVQDMSVMFNQEVYDSLQASPSRRRRERAKRSKQTMWQTLKRNLENESAREEPQGLVLKASPQDAHPLLSFSGDSNFEQHVLADDAKLHRSVTFNLDQPSTLDHDGEFPGVSDSGISNRSLLDSSFEKLSILSTSEANAALQGIVSTTIHDAALSYRGKLVEVISKTDCDMSSDSFASQVQNGMGDQVIKTLIEYFLGELHNVVVKFAPSEEGFAEIFFDTLSKELKVVEANWVEYLRAHAFEQRAMRLKEAAKTIPATT